MSSEVAVPQSGLELDSFERSLAAERVAEQTLMRSITRVLFAFGDEARVFSGHGPPTTIGRERQSNPFVLEWEAGKR